MGFRFRKSFKIAPGVKLNIGKRSTGISFGGKHGGISFNSKSGTRIRSSIPGTGISYSSKIGGKSRKTKMKPHKHKAIKASPQKAGSSQNGTTSDQSSVGLGGLATAVIFILSGFSYLGKSIGVGLLTAAIGILIIFFVFKKERDDIKKIEQDIEKSKEQSVSVPDDAAPAVSPEIPVKAELIKESFTVAGVSYYKVNIMKLACANPDWRKHVKTLLAENKHTVYRYNFIYKPVKLIPEPENEHDPNAILVQIAGEKVGYIGREENIHIKDILENRSVKYISAFISGGDYKVISDAGLMDKDTQEIGINIRIAYS